MTTILYFLYIKYGGTDISDIYLLYISITVDRFLWIIENMRRFPKEIADFHSSAWVEIVIIPLGKLKKNNQIYQNDWERHPR